LLSTTRAELSEIVSDGFHPPPPGQDGRHQGVDFAYYRKFGRDSIGGESVQAILPGKVAAIIHDRFPYGNALMIETPAGLVPFDVKSLALRQGKSLYVLYAHLEKIYPNQLGQAIASCQLIGTVGKSGNAGVPHLHLEIRIGKEAQTFASMAYYIADASPEERQAYLWWRISGEFQAIDPLVVLFADGQ
jgi:murein DD-endopeptidase MepM/ murein hydrolase activator NlpD